MAQSHSKYVMMTVTTRCKQYIHFTHDEEMQSPPLSAHNRAKQMILRMSFN